MERTKQQKAERLQADISQKRAILLGFFDACEKKIWLTPRIQQRKTTIGDTTDIDLLDTYFTRIEHAYTKWLQKCTDQQKGAYHDLCSSHKIVEQQEEADLNTLLDQI